MEWRLADAKNKFTELVNRALSEAPQRVKGLNDVVIVIAERDYEELTRTKPSFKEFLLQDSPTFDELDLKRNRSSMRDVEL